jgi:hypothetical protein
MGWIVLKKEILHFIYRQNAVSANYISTMCQFYNLAAAFDNSDFGKFKFDIKS